MKIKPLIINNASENNLKNLTLEIPHNTFTALTGLSGSGKSSLAFDTVYAEGQRRYIETFSPYTRQFFDKVKKPSVDDIQNVRPAIAIQQRTRITSTRSTVGTLTNLIDYLKVIWANIASPVCPKCGLPLESWTPEKLTTRLIKLFSVRQESTFIIGAPLQLASKTAHAELLRLSTLGFSRVYDEKSLTITPINDETINDLSRLDKIVVALDRIGKTPPSQTRVRDAIEQAFSLANGNCIIIEDRGEHGGSLRRWLRIPNSENLPNIKTNHIERYFYSTSYTCGEEQFTFEKPRPSLFSHNHPAGACSECKGFGRILSIDQKLCVPNTDLSIEEKALACWAGDASRGEFKKLLTFCKSENISTKKPWKNLSKSEIDKIFNHRSKAYRGISHWFKKLEKKAYKMHVRVFLSRYRSQFICPSCNATRLKPSALAYVISGMRFPEILAFPIENLLLWLQELQILLKDRQQFSRELEFLFSATISRLECLVELGLPYLTLDRLARTLSGGETQRVNLATAVGSELISTHFVLDEPSVGLHPRDSERLLVVLKKLASRENSLLLVEHDLECLSAAERIIELGPKAGKEGGQVVYNGEVSKWSGIKLNDPQILGASKTSKNKNQDKSIQIRNALARNLKGFNLTLPLSTFTVLSGVSGSGKTSLVQEVIKNAWQIRERGELPLEQHNVVEGLDKIDQLLFIDQSPLSKSPRANIATYSKIWEEVRNILASSDGAKVRALNKSAFSFNVDGGRCPACKGAGFIREDMQFLSDVYVSCDRCLGKRFQDVVLEVKFQNRNVFDFLEMTVEQASIFFQNRSSIRDSAELLCTLGLGHLTLGHPLSELSGGEAQRLKLIPLLQEAKGGNSLLIFDEPSTGLHLHDVENLITLLRSLRDRGHTVLCIEHNLAIIGCADWIIDMGPEGGERGGHLLFEGPPNKLIERSNDSKFISYTAKALKDFVESISNQAPKKPPSNIKKLEKQDRSKIEIIGAREHNLKNLDLSVPLNQVVTITGVSGSGKSTLAKDIIYAEGQRRFLDCLSPYARQFIKELKRPDIDHIENIQPTICVYQHTFQPSQLSTVATMSEVYSFLRLLYAKIGLQYCPDHPNQKISPLSINEIVNQIVQFKIPNVRLLAPVIKLKKGHHNEVLQRAIESEITEVRVDGLFGSPSKFLDALDKKKVHTIEYTIGKLNPSQVEPSLISDAVSQCVALSGGTLLLHTPSKEEVFSLDRTCSICKRGFFKPDPEDLSFNSKRGVCSSCSGSGKGRGDKPCPTCNGTRLASIGRNIRLGELNIYEATLLTPQKLADFLKREIAHSTKAQIAESVLNELLAKLRSLHSVGLDYLALNRDCTTLSSGELQRLRLATAMGSPLSGVIYIFDEPSAGLHPRDNRAVIARLKDLKEQGNSVIMIEHDPESILSSDYIIDVGPGGGKDGGQIVFSGSRDQLLKSKSSKTAAALRGEIVHTLEENSQLSDNSDAKLEELIIKEGKKNNLHCKNIKIPLFQLVAVGGVAGAGKSSLVHGLIADTITLGNCSETSWSYEGCKIESSTKIERVLFIDQKPIGINSRSTPASYLGIFDEIRKVFANTVEAKARGWKAGHFSYNTGNGRCSECKGLGQIKLEMNFLPDAFIECSTCGGSRYLAETDSIHYRDLSISNILKLTFEEAKPIFTHHRKIYHAIHLACEIGLGYLSLGQSSTTLSGGESQRMKLVSELSAPRRGHTLYILDEPTTGLHKLDVSRLVKILKGLVSKQNSVIVIEHDEDVILQADWMLEVGPGPGAAGGKIIFQGKPSELTKKDTPWGEELRA